MPKYSITAAVDMNQIKDAFEYAEVSFSDSRAKILLEILDDKDIEIKERLSESLLEIIKEIVDGEWE